MRVLTVLALVLAGLFFYGSRDSFTAEKAPAAVIVEGHNKLCPVSGEPVSGEDYAIYKGVRYGLCCPACRAAFLKDSGKYIPKMVEQEATPPSTVKVVPAVLMPHGAAEKKKGASSGLSA
ncbi:MAG: hypothetical protein KTQ49_04065 [Candidatus Omnitrophica bacterium]|nr:hypothetical protein [Candidatus Omnitrophota bacterium]